MAKKQAATPVEVKTEKKASVTKTSKEAAPKKAPVKKATKAKEESVHSAISQGFSLFTDFDIYLFRQGKHYRLYEKLGAHICENDGVKGTFFAVWAPNASHVSVMGDFNEWNPEAGRMAARSDGSGIWEIFMPGVGHGSLYKYMLRNAHSGQILEKFDPFAFFNEVPPKRASIVWDLKFDWKAKTWLGKKGRGSASKAWSVYEVHAGSWRKPGSNEDDYLSYADMGRDLVEYVKEMGFTHIEFMPLTEHPYSGSWGYQTTGFFAPTSRFGTPQDFMAMVDSFHEAGIGVILDWVPSHFPEDSFALAQFDGTHLYEHQDPRKGFHPDWKSLIFNYGRFEVRSFLISSAMFWADVYKVDGLRVDAVASMLYLDYSRKEGEWEPNIYGGNENLEAISFLKELNETMYYHFPEIQMIAEESTSWSKVSRPVYDGGLGFGMKWMMGWMHDTLRYFKTDPLYREHHQSDVTFSIYYAFTENFMLPLSHDEVVHGKGSLIDRMPGDQWQKFANLRAMYSYMFTHPGSKLLFMGGEFGQYAEWNYKSSLDWHLTGFEPHSGMQKLIKDLNALYRKEPALHSLQFDAKGFEWIDLNDSRNSTLSYIRRGENPDDFLIVVCNLTPVPQENYRIGVPLDGKYSCIFNSDDKAYWGSEFTAKEKYESADIEQHGRPFSVALDLPPLSVQVFKHAAVAKKAAVKKKASTKA
ncbi:MAG: 1,4-alpha-glucan branching protein GlgB [Bacteroidota bacterium]|jgi:1,4-alpha-glucan branching enzyme